MFDKKEWSRQWNLKNPNYYRENARKRELENPTAFKESQRKRSAKWAATPRGAEKRREAGIRFRSNPENRPRIKGSIARSNERQMDKTPELFWVRRIWTKYRMRPESYYKMLAKQGGSCAFCASDNGGKRLCVDHDHSKPKGEGNRWLLCDQCNFMIGNASEDSERLRTAASELDKYHGRTGNCSGFYIRGEDNFVGSSAALSLPG